MRFELFDESKSIHRIRIKPNANNQILIPDSGSNDDVNQTDDNLTPLLCIHHLSCSNRCTRMEPKIVKLALQVLDKRTNEQHDEHEKEQFNKRITKMEATLERIAEHMLKK